MNRKTKKAGEKDEVEELLQAAQDDMLLKLSLDSHLSRGVSVGDADIDRRFQALKLKTTTTNTPAVVRGGGSAAAAAAAASKSNQTKSKSNSLKVDEELKAVLGDDLSTRFAALKASSSSSSSTIQLSSDFNNASDDNDDDEEDEVEKLIRWAKDSARLDPSPPSDDDDDDKSESDDEEVDLDRKGKST